MADCDSIAHLVDMLGTRELLAIAAAPSESNIDVNVEVHSTKAAAAGASTDGLHFSGAHWYSRKNGGTKNSYGEDYQKQGTAHFCQTFAVMIHRGNDDLPLEHRLIATEHSKNIKKAMDFWLDFFKANKNIRDWFLLEIKLTYQQLKLTLLDIRGSAESLVSCQHGL